jgi:hypothetical protein
MLIWNDNLNWHPNYDLPRNFIHLLCFILHSIDCLPGHDEINTIHLGLAIIQRPALLHCSSENLAQLMARFASTPKL